MASPKLKTNKSEEFENHWRDAFPGVAVPRLTCLENIDSGDLSEDEQQTFRKSLQTALDYHTLRIDDLQKKLRQQQFILEYIAKEVEALPIPREASSSPSMGNIDRKPTPRPRKAAPIIPKKPSKSKSSVSEETTVPVGLRRNRSTPSPRSSAAVEKRHHFSSVFVPSDHSIEEASPSLESAVVTLKTTQADKESDNADERFQAFQGKTFGGSIRSSSTSGTSSNAVSNPAAGSPAIIKNQIISHQEPTEPDEQSTPNVARNSMRKMDQIVINDTESSNSDSSPEDNYMQLWSTEPLASKQRDSSSSASAEGAGQVLDENVDDSSAASLRSVSAKSKKGSRMVRVDYSDKNGGPQAIRNDNDDSTNADSAFDSDEEDDKPQYVRLVYNAYSVVKFLKPDDTDSVISGTSLDAEVSSGAQSSTLTAKYRYRGPQRNTIFFDSSFDIEAKGKGCASEQGVASTANKQPYQMQGSVAVDGEPKELDDENFKMRNWVVNSVLESEKSYIDDLNILLQYKKSLESAAQSSMPMISLADIATIFGNLQEIHEIHTLFRKRLEPLVAEWTQHSEVGTLFKEMVVNLQHYNTYLENYPNAIATVKKCCQENQAFDNLVKLIKCPSTQEMHHLEEILHKPINRMQRNSLLLQDLIKCTPPTHSDHRMLQGALKLSQHFLRDQMSLSSTANDKAPLHVLVKNQLLVEYVAGKARKLRHVFLFNDLIVCTKCVIVKGKQHYEVKWHLLLSDLQLSDKMDDTPVEWKQRAAKAEKEIQAMNAKLKEHKAQLRRELKECKDKNVDTSTNSRIQRLTKRIQEQEANLILAEPRLRFTFSTKKGTQFCFLLPSDYERREWQENIQALKAKLPADSKLKISSLEAQSIIDTCKDNVHLNNVNQMVMKEATDEDIVSGQLNLTIHKILGLQSSCETFTAIEVDSFGHFYLKAKTSVMESDNPVWNESFAIDLESSSTLRLICYKRTSDGDILLGKCPLNLHKQWLKQGFQEKELSLNEVTLTVSIKYQTAEQTIRRIPSKIESGIFGVKLSSTCNKEGLKVPAFVTACIEDVEKRGIDEMGIYRVSGTTSDVQRIRKAFDKNPRVGKTLLPEVEINAVTGALKLYLRELPEAIITDALYPNLIDAYKIQDKEEQEKKMIALLGSLPDPNYYTMMAILEHLIRVGNHEAHNKMPFHNLAVVFGPTLLKPAVKAPPSGTMDLFSSGANDAMYQSGIIFYYLTLLNKGVTFR